MRITARSLLLMICITSNSLFGLSKEHELYLLHCSGCHGLKGEGVVGVSPQINRIIGYFLANREGRKYIIKLPGIALAPLSDEQLADLLNWVVSQFSSPSFSFQKFTKEEISKERKEPLWDIEKERKELLKRLPGNRVLSRSWEQFISSASPKQ
ncbi:hypothetical protein IT6_04790 [Methylacidiphilum caldifontis]|uniref:c-type cytochrome n=1 Tax=Methylacidiphilum caldifontis TaxID=2795386 RepID=UPI001A8CCBFC|nr:cytochrome c [Methylacidiphilum caldifontis]QSR89588.1 hypothetical protein IT6_04790 [Methylacidiphilum caldifontis]